MRVCGNCVLAWLFVGAAFGQNTEDVLRSKLTAVRYAPLAEMAMIQGDVRLAVNGGVITVLSGHPLLTPIAVSNAKGWGSVRTQSKLDLTYHFVIVGTAKSAPTVTTGKKGNALTRATAGSWGEN
jgi:hypothetical protein